MFFVSDEVFVESRLTPCVVVKVCCVRERKFKSNLVLAVVLVLEAIKCLIDRKISLFDFFRVFFY